MHYDPKHAKKKTSFSHAAVIFAVVCLCLALSVVGTVAWLTKADSNSNTFSAGTVDVNVQESFDSVNMTKTDVFLKNDGNSPVYVRAIISIYWEDSDGFVMAEIPDPNSDYTISWNTSSANWFQDGDIYYYRQRLVEGTSTDILIEECRQVREYDDGRVLVVDIAGQAIQAVPFTAVEEAWGVAIDENGNISL